MRGNTETHFERNLLDNEMLGEKEAVKQKYKASLPPKKETRKERTVQ